MTPTEAEHQARDLAAHLGRPVTVWQGRDGVYRYTVSHLADVLMRASPPKDGTQPKEIKG